LEILSETVWQLITDQTNLYAAQFTAAHPNLKQQSRECDWVDTNIKEIKKERKLLVLQEIIQKPRNVFFFKRESMKLPSFQKELQRYHLLWQTHHLTPQAELQTAQNPTHSQPL
jgi:hypothetical protein